MPFTEKVLRALRLKRVRHALVEPSSREDYRRWSPDTGLLPVLEIDGTRVADSAAILDRLDARFPEPPLSARPRSPRSPTIPPRRGAPRSGLAVDRDPGGRTLLAAHPGLPAHTVRVADATRGRPHRLSRTGRPCHSLLASLRDGSRKYPPKMGEFCA